jgi:hypothetical protein
MSTASTIARRWKPIVSAVLFGAAEAFVINKVSAESPAWWWWPLLVVALVGVIGCAIWAVLPRADKADVARGDNTIDVEVKDGGVVTQQSAGAKGQNVSVYADNGSFAANRVDKIKEINLGEPGRQADPEEPRQS